MGEVIKTLHVISQIRFKLIYEVLNETPRAAVHGFGAICVDVGCLDKRNISRDSLLRELCSRASTLSLYHDVNTDPVQNHAPKLNLA